MSKVRREAHKSLVKESIGAKESRRNRGNQKGVVIGVVKVPTIYMYIGYELHGDERELYKKVSRKTYKKMFFDNVNKFTALDILNVIGYRDLKTTNVLKVLVFMNQLIINELDNDKNKLKDVIVKNNGLNKFKFIY